MIFSDPKGIVESFVSIFPTANYDLDILFYIFRIKNIPLGKKWKVDQL